METRIARKNDVYTHPVSFSIRSCRSRHCIFLGYPLEFRGWKYPTKKVISRDVVFVETELPGLGLGGTSGASPSPGLLCVALRVKKPPVEFWKLPKDRTAPAPVPEADDEVPESDDDAI